MSIRNQFFKGVIWTVIESWGSRFITFFVFFTLARLLEPKDFGLIALASVFTAFVQIFLDQGLGTAIVQRKNLEPEHLDSAFWTNVGTGVVLTTLSIALSVPVSLFFKQPDLAPVVRWASLGILINSFSSVQEALFQRDLNFKLISIRSLIATLVSGIAGVGMAFAGCGVWSLVVQQLTNAFMRVLVLWISSAWRPRFKFSYPHFQDLFGFGINLLGVKIFQFANSRADNLVIGYFFDATTLGYYAVAKRLADILLDLFSHVVSRTMVPVLSKLQEDNDRLKKTFYLAIETTVLIAFPCFMWLAVLAPNIVPVLYGDKWSLSIPILQTLAIAYLLQAIYYSHLNVLTAKGKTDWQIKLVAFSSVLSLTGFIFAARWGASGVAAAQIVQGLISVPILLKLIDKLVELDFRLYLKRFSYPLLASLASSFIAILTRRLFLNNLGNIPTLAICLAISIPTYLLILNLMNPRMIEEIYKIISVRLLKRNKKSASAEAEKPAEATERL